MGNKILSMFYQNVIGSMLMLIFFNHLFFQLFLTTTKKPNYLALEALTDRVNVLMQVAGGLVDWNRVLVVLLGLHTLPGFCLQTSQ